VASILVGVEFSSAQRQVHRLEVQTLAP